MNQSVFEVEQFLFQKPLEILEHRGENRLISSGTILKNKCNSVDIFVRFVEKRTIFVIILVSYTGYLLNDTSRALDHTKPITLASL